jgi:uncharacterized protein (DUF2147 family)
MMRSIWLVGLVLSAVVSPFASSPALSSDATAAESRPPESATPSPVGVWRTIDDATGKAKSLVAISERDGVLFGRVEKLLDPDPNDPHPRCHRCEGAFKDKPILGLQVLWGLQWDGEKWSGGRALDPDNGKVYRCYLAMEEGHDRLKLRGFIGISLLGRTQHWLRER